MNRKINSSIIIVILCILLSSCVPKDKEIVISKNVKGNADSTEIMTLVQEGTDYLNMGKNDAAKSVFEKIIKKSKNNPEMYRANTLRRLINDTSWEGCKKENINFRYVYRLADTGEQVFEILLTPADYQTQK